MHRHLIVIVLLALGGWKVSAQNMVTNPGFEVYNNCPSQRGQINYSPGYDTFLTVRDWVDPTNTSPDYFNRCGTDSSVRLPYLSVDGYHEPHSGDACAGIAVFSGNPVLDTTDYWSEYLETRLTAPMQAGHTYYVSFYVCLTYHGRTGYNIISVDRLGARLSNNMIDTLTPPPMFFMTGEEDISSPPGQFITDTINWTLISGIYHATGGEQWLTIGRFYEVPIKYEWLRTSELQPNSNSICYMLVDDVCTIDMSTSTGSDTVVYSPQFPIVTGDSRPGKYLWYNGDTTAQTKIPAVGSYVRERWDACVYYTDTFTADEMPVENCLWLPSAFTPNNEGENDLFGPGNSYCQPDFKSFRFVIYNRWGQQVFESFDAGEKWNGTFNGHNAETGTYYYILEYGYGGGFSALNSNAATAPKLIKGDVTLIR